MGSALTSCAGGDAVRATGKRRRRHSGAPCLTPPPSTLPLPAQPIKPPAAFGVGKSQLQYQQPQKGMAPDLLPYDVSMWNSNRSRRSASASERSGTPSPAPPSPRMRSSRPEASDYTGGGSSRADARTLPTAAVDSLPPIDGRRSVHRALFSSAGAMADSTAFSGQLAPSAETAARSTVDLVRDIGDGCVSPASTAAAADALRQRHHDRGDDDIVQCHGSSEVSASAYSRGSVRFRIVSQPQPAAASRLCRSASEALSIACRWPRAAGTAAGAEAAVASAARTTGSGAEQCAIRPATGDFTSWTVVGKRPSGKPSGQTETEPAETTAFARRADSHVERTSEEAPQLPLPSPTLLELPTAAAEASPSFSVAGDDHFDDKDDTGSCRSATGHSLKAEECETETAAAAAGAAMAPYEVHQPASEQPTSLSVQPALSQLPPVDENRTSRSGSSSSSSSDSSTTSERSDAMANLQSPPPALPQSHGGRPTLLAHTFQTLVGGSGRGNDGSSSRLPSWMLNSPPSPSGSVGSSSGKPRQPPPKPPRTYSYRASMQPKRISRTTEEFVAMWDELRRSLLASQPFDDAGGPSGGGELDDEDEEDSGIYMNHYAARARGWQILTLAQEVLALHLDAPAAVQGLVRLGYIDTERRRTLLDAAMAPCGGRDLADALIDVMLEKGDACFDAFRAFLRGCDYDGCSSSHQADLAQLLDTLDDVLSIGVAARGRNFALTTKQCAVTCGGSGYRGEDIGVGHRWRSLISDRGAAAVATLDSGSGDCGLDDTASVGRSDGNVDDDDGPTCALDLYDERFGDASCERLAATIRNLNRVSSLRLAKNGITAAGAHALSTALAAPAAEGAVGRLTHLDLRLNAIGNGGLASIAAALRSAACSLEVLVLSHAGLTTGCGRLLADALLANRRFGEAGSEECVSDRPALADGEEEQPRRQRRLLRVLDLSHNEADDGDCDALADALGGGGGAPLHRLNLRGNAFGGRGCARLCSAIAGGRGGGCRLACLDLSRNRVLDDGARALAAALASSACRLRELYAEGCGVTAAGCTALCVALTTGRSSGAGATLPPPRSLSSLSLSNNPIADEGLRCLSEALLAAAADDDGHEDYDYCDDDSGGACGGLRTLRVDLCGGSPEAVGDLLRAVRLRNSSLEALSARRRTFDRCSASSCCSLRSPPPVVSSGGADVYDGGRQSLTASVDARAQPGRSSQGGLERRRGGTET